MLLEENISSSPKNKWDTVRALEWCNGAVRVLDQRYLPTEIRYEVCASAHSIAQAIASMQVRGAPAIGIAAAYGVVLAVQQRYLENPATWKTAVQSDIAELALSRPTAVNLAWALSLMRQEIEQMAHKDDDPLPSLLKAALSLHETDITTNHTIGECGADILQGVRGVLTHCNTGSLATGGYGTALGVIRSIYGRQKCSVFATETRPWQQGSRLTAWELEQDAIPVTLIADSAAAYLMKLGKVQWIIVGADRIAANGDTANKIGTYALAVAARQHGVKCMIAAPTSTFDWNTESGQGICIEERDARELVNAYFLRTDSHVTAWNPVFDVTPAELIDVIVTEKGAIFHPNRNTLHALQK